LQVHINERGVSIAVDGLLRLQRTYWAAAAAADAKNSSRKVRRHAVAAVVCICCMAASLRRSCRWQLPAAMHQRHVKLQHVLMLISVQWCLQTSGDSNEHGVRTLSLSRLRCEADCQREATKRRIPLIRV
jgi:hypothetical protein